MLKMFSRKRVMYTVVFSIVGVFLISSVANAFWPFDGPKLAPSENTDVSVNVGNAAPIITIIALEDPIPLAAGGSYAANIDFTAEDPNGLPVGNLEDSSVAISFDFPTGGPPYTETRTATIADCTPSDLGNVRTYDCSITMEFYDAPGLWDVSVSVSDTDAIPLTGTDTAITAVSLNRHIVLTGGTPINFGPVAPGQADKIATPTTVKNDGNDVGTLDVTAYQLAESTGTDFIPAANFNAAGINEADVCAGVGTTTLVQAIATTVASTDLQRGAAATEDIKWCLDVPAGIISAAYSTTEIGSQIWTIGI